MNLTMIEAIGNFFEATKGSSFQGASAHRAVKFSEVFHDTSSRLKSARKHTENEPS